MLDTAPQPQLLSTFDLTWLKIKRYQDWLVAAGLAVLVFLVSLPIFSNSYDDAYITYRYAYNFASGKGFVYNAGENHLGTTTPLYSLALGVLGIPSPDSIPSISGILAGLSLFATALALYVLARRKNQAFVGLIAGLFFILCPLSLNTFGGEVLPLTALVLWGYIAYDAERFATAGILLGLAALTRGDATLAMGLIGLHYLFTRRRIPWRMSLAFAGILALWFAFAFIQGIPFLPDTLSAKTAQGKSGLWPTYFEGIPLLLNPYLGRGLFQGYAAFPWLRVYIYLILPGLLAVILRSRYLWFPVTWAALHALIYEQIKAPYYHWYYMPLVLGVCVLVGAALGALPPLFLNITNFLQKPRWELPAQGLAWVIVLVLSVPPLLEGARLALGNGLVGQPSPAIATYHSIGEWLRSSTPEDASVGYFEVGVIGFYSHRRIIDPLGLVTNVPPSQILENNLAWAYRELLPDYILVSPRFEHWLGPYRQEAWFQSCYREIQRIDTPGGETIVYKRCPSGQAIDHIILEKTQTNRNKIAGEIYQERTVGQTFIAQQNNLSSVGFLMANFDQPKHGRLIFHLRYADQAEQDTDLVTLELDLNEVQNNEWKLFNFSPIKDSAGKKFYAYLEAPDSGPGNAVTTWGTKKDRYPDGEMLISQQPNPGDLTFRLYYSKLPSS